MTRRVVTRRRPTILRDPFSHYTGTGRPKKVWLSEDSALAALADTNCTHVYKCAGCGLWHLAGGHS